MLKVFMFVFFFWTIICQLSEGLHMADGEVLSLKIDPTNKESITIEIDGKQIVNIPLEKPAPTLEETFGLPSDLIQAGKDEEAGAGAGHLTSKKTPANEIQSLRTLFSDKEFEDKKKENETFDPKSFQEKVVSLSRELFDVIEDSKDTNNIENVYSAAKYQEDVIREYFEKQLELWDRVEDKKAAEPLSRKKIELLSELFKKLVSSIRDQVAKKNSDFDLLGEEVKTINDYNATILRKDIEIV